MSKIKDLKQKQEYNINLVNVLEKFVPEDKKAKYLETLCKLFTDGITVNDSELKTKFANKFGFQFDTVENLNKYEQIFLGLITEIPQFNNEYVLSFTKYIDYNERKLVDNNDIQKFKSFLEIKSEVDAAEKREEEKILEKQVYKMLDNEDWLVLKPLTYESSLKYGASTTWCTASEKYPSQYESYTKTGSLIYIINKKKNTKHAAYCKVTSGVKNISFWNDTDKQVDSILCGFNKEVHDLILDDFDVYETNKKVITNAQLSEKILKDTSKNKLVDKVVNAFSRYEENSAPTINANSGFSLGIDVANNNGSISFGTNTNQSVNTFNSIGSPNPGTPDESYKEVLETITRYFTEVNNR